MSNLTIFDFNTTKIRVVMIENEPWFVATDLAVVLEYEKVDKMLKHVDEEDKKIINPQKLDDSNLEETFSSNTFRLSIVNESGLYAVIFGSRKPEAKVFKKWVTSEVLPSIRKTGKYEVNKHGLEEKMDKFLNELQELKTQIKKQEVVSTKLKESYSGVVNILNTSVNSENTDNQKIQEIFKIVDALKLFDVIKYFRPKYLENPVISQKLVNKVRRNASSTIRDLSLKEISKIKNSLVFTKEQVPSLLNTIDRCYKELITLNFYEENDDQFKLDL
jgi:prophage antirepressor-like protein